MKNWALEKLNKKYRNINYYTQYNEESKMNEYRHGDHEREIPHAHLYHAIMPIFFFVIWFLDSNMFRISNFLDGVIPLLVRLILYVLVLV